MTIRCFCVVQKKKGVADAMIEAVFELQIGIHVYPVFGLDHRVGHLASMTASDNPWLDIVQGCHTRAAAPSYAMEWPHDRGVRDRKSVV